MSSPTTTVAVSIRLDGRSAIGVHEPVARSRIAPSVNGGSSGSAQSAPGGHSSDDPPNTKRRSPTVAADAPVRPDSGAAGSWDQPG